MRRSIIAGLAALALFGIATPGAAGADANDGEPLSFNADNWPPGGKGAGTFNRVESEGTAPTREAPPASTGRLQAPDPKPMPKSRFEAVNKKQMRLEQLRSANDAYQSELDRNAAAKRRQEAAQNRKAAMADKQAKDLEAYKKQRRRERARSNYDKKLRRDLQRY